MRNVGTVNASNQISYSKDSRLAGDPGGNTKVIAARTSQQLGNRNIRQVEEDYSAGVQPIDGSCLSVTKSGNPCKARPAEGESFCTFHKE
jgi:hypothetical protein